MLGSTYSPKSAIPTLQRRMSGAPPVVPNQKSALKAMADFAFLFVYQFVRCFVLCSLSATGIAPPLRSLSLLGGCDASTKTPPPGLGMSTPGCSIWSSPGICGLAFADAAIVWARTFLVESRRGRRVVPWAEGEAESRDQPIGRPWYLTEPSQFSWANVAFQPRSWPRAFRLGQGLQAHWAKMGKVVLVRAHGLVVLARRQCLEVALDDSWVGLVKGRPHALWKGFQGSKGVHQTRSER
ncbi:hypothetical protein B0J13DRAFT_38745 [Dactylonectria estremocensis]|uniref:Uncharacterized protein n=1 Tax=Dactylonectria estremocensis TaxID=1079267 RepID=A0A9P9FL94_9HYPO|nr:hypothetical protein B0J13DRAFT_38745 [Dactylonectria estremocensis]